MPQEGGGMRTIEMSRRTGTKLLLRAQFAAVLTLGLAACATSENGGPGGDGNTVNLPTEVPQGSDPSGGAGSAGCVIADASYDDDVTVPENVTCSFAKVTVEGNLVLAPGASVTSVGGHVDGNVLVYPNGSYDADGTSIGG